MEMIIPWIWLAGIPAFFVFLVLPAAAAVREKHWKSRAAGMLACAAVLAVTLALFPGVEEAEASSQGSTAASSAVQQEEPEYYEPEESGSGMNGTLRGILLIVYVAASYWAINRVIFSRVNTYVAFAWKFVLGAFLGWLLIPVAIIMLLFRKKKEKDSQNRQG